MSKVSITTADLERLLKMSLRYALPSNGTSPSVVADLFKAHIGELRTEFIQASAGLIFNECFCMMVSDMHMNDWLELKGFLNSEIMKRLNK